MADDEVTESVKIALSEVMGLEPEEINADAKLGKDLDLDELDLIEIVMALEEALGIVIADEQLDADLSGEQHQPDEEGVVHLSSRYMDFDLPQQYISLDITVGQLVEILQQLRDTPR